VSPELKSEAVFKSKVRSELPSLKELRKLMGKHGPYIKNSSGVRVAEVKMWGKQDWAFALQVLEVWEALS
jgi:hypothetical protein